MPGQFLPIRDPVLIFAALLSIALLAPLLFSRLKLPGIIGLIVAGVVLGPHALRVLERGREVEMLGAVGLLYIMFLAGLELDLSQFIRDRRHSGVFGLLTFSIPLVLGSLMARYLLVGFTWPAAILLASMFSSHTLITYPIASQLGITKSRAVTTTIGGTILTDTAALLVLAVIAASYQGEAGWLFWLRLFALMIVYMAAVVAIIPRLGRWFFRSVATDGVTAFIGVMAAVFVCAYFAHLAGLEPIIGAFLAGLVLNSLIPEKSALMNRIQFVGNALFIPFFLISVGMLVNVRMLVASPDAWEIAGAMVLAGLATKWLAARGTEKWFGYTSDEGMLIYGLSVNQAAATLAAVLVGYNIGIFGEEVLTGTIMMILFTSLAGSWITDRYARRVALHEEQKPYQPSTAPHRILVPLDNPRNAEELMDLALMLRRRDSKEPLYPLTVARAGINAEERVAAGEKLLGYAVVRAISANVPVVPITRAAMDVKSGIAQALVDLRISTIVAGWDGVVSSRQRTFGGILDGVIRESQQMVLVSRCVTPINTMKRAILALPPLIERQPGFEIAVRAIRTLASQLGTSLLTVGLPETLDKTAEVRQRVSVQEWRQRLEGWGDFLPWLEKASTGDDLLVMLNARKGRLAWQPALDRIPSAISDRFSALNFIAVYPPEMPWGEESGPPTPPPKEKSAFCSIFLPADHVRLGLEGNDPAEAIRELLSSAFAGREAVVARLTWLLTGIAAKEPVELTPGAVLLHSHIPEVPSSTVFLGIHSQSWRLSHATAPVKALFLLLSPEGGPPEAHLQVLAELARLLHRPGIVKKLAAAASPAEVLDLLA